MPLTITRKLTLGVGVLLGMLILLGGFSYVQTERLNRQLVHLIEHQEAVSVAGYEMEIKERSNEMAKDVMTWPELAEELYDKLTGRNAEISYEFHDFEVYVPAHHAEDAVLAKWKFNGLLKIRTKDMSAS